MVTTRWVTSTRVSYQVIENLFSYDIDHFETLTGGDTVDEEVAMEADKLCV